MPDSSAANLVAIDEAIGAFRHRLRDACQRAGREPDDVTLIAVTKNHPAEYAAQAVRSGLVELGENKPQELEAKHDGLLAIDAALADSVTWHFVGRLQRNKAKQVVAYADIVHSIDRLPLADAVAKAAAASDRWGASHPMPVLLQVNLDPDAARMDHDSTASRGGVHPLDLAALADAAAAHDVLQVRGVMAVAPLGHEAAACFARLHDLSERLRVEHPDATLISAGMTADFPAAIENGATHVRVGTALFGARALA